MRRKYSKNLSTKFRQAKKFRKEMTPSESLLWSRLRGNQLMGMHFRRQHVIRGFIVDFYCHRARLVIEIDGDIHQSKIIEDAIRDKILESMGLVMVHLSADKVEKNLTVTLGDIQTACLRKIPDLPLPGPFPEN